MSAGNQAQELSGALFSLDPNGDREHWVRCLTSFKAGGGGIESALSWSEGGDSFKSQDFHSTWRSINADGGITEKTLFHMARDGGWTPDSNVRYEIRPRSITPPPPSKTQPYAMDIWKGCNCEDAVVAAHPYALRKEIAWACGAGRATVTGSLVGKDIDCLIVPQRTLGGDVIGVECINPDGVKQSFGKKGVLILGNTLDETLLIYIVEGWADGAAAWRYFGNVTVVVVFGIGKQDKIGRQLSDARPGREIIIVRDA